MKIDKIEKVVNKLVKRMDDMEEVIKEALSSGSIKGVLVKCTNCNHMWKTRSKMQKISCPDCGAKISNIPFNSNVKETGLKDARGRELVKEGGVLYVKCHSLSDVMNPENHQGCCSKCKKNLEEIESNPYGMCNDCWKKTVRKADMSCFDDIMD